MTIPPQECAVELDEILSSLDRAPYKVKRIVLGFLVQKLLPRHRGDDELSICDPQGAVLGYFLTPEARGRMIEPNMLDEIRSRQASGLDGLTTEETIAAIERLEQAK